MGEARLRQKTGHWRARLERRPADHRRPNKCPLEREACRNSNGANSRASNTGIPAHALRSRPCEIQTAVAAV